MSHSVGEGTLLLGHVPRVAAMVGSGWRGSSFVGHALGQPASEPAPPARALPAQLVSSERGNTLKISRAM
jgi:hypothetical protein